MALIASLVVGANSATTLDGGSAQLSTQPDRARFLKLHRSAGAIITGKNSAAAEDYSKTTVPIFVFSRKPEKLIFEHPMMQQITVDRDLGEISRRIDARIDGDVVIEAGPELLATMIEAGVVDELQLSVSPIEGDGNFIDVEKLLTHFVIEKEEQISSTRLLQCRYRGDAANS
jgi:riboflavin biosynthesis pyrimidine reductase